VVSRLLSHASSASAEFDSQLRTGFDHLYRARSQKAGDRTSWSYNECVYSRITIAKPCASTKLYLGLECGATFVDREFLEYLRNIIVLKDEDMHEVGNGGHTISSSTTRSLLARFEPIKNGFGADLDDQTYTITNQEIALNTQWAQNKIRAGVVNVTQYVGN